MNQSNVLGTVLASEVDLVRDVPEGFPAQLWFIGIKEVNILVQPNLGNSHVILKKWIKANIRFQTRIGLYTLL